MPILEHSPVRRTSKAPFLAVLAAIVSGCACPTGPWGPGHWPPACWTPYNSSSPFNQPLPANPRYVANSDRIVARVLGANDLDRSGTVTQPANLAIYKSGNSGWPTYYLQSTDPTFTITCTKFGGNCGKLNFGAPGDPFQLRLPANAQVQGGSTNPLLNGPDADRHLTVIDQGTGYENDFWQVQTSPLPPGGGPLNVSWGGRTSISGDGLHSDGTASRFGNLAGRVRVEELNAGVINHALTITINCGSWHYDQNHNQVADSVFPADKGDKICSNPTDAPAMGARFQLAMTSQQIDALSIPAWKKTLLHAMSEYGMFFGDTGSNFFFDIQTEAGSQYTSMGYPDPWLAFAQAQVAAGNADFQACDASCSGVNEDGYAGLFQNGNDNLDWKRDVWSNLKVVTPCVSSNNCPAPPACSAAAVSATISFNGVSAASGGQPATVGAPAGTDVTVQLTGSAPCGVASMSIADDYCRSTGGNTSTCSQELVAPHTFTNPQPTATWTRTFHHFAGDTDSMQLIVTDVSGNSVMTPNFGLNWQ